MLVFTNSPKTGYENVVYTRMRSCICMRTLSYTYTPRRYAVAFIRGENRGSFFSSSSGAHLNAKERSALNLQIISSECRSLNKVKKKRNAANVTLSYFIECYNTVPFLMAAPLREGA